MSETRTDDQNGNGRNRISDCYPTDLAQENRVIERGGYRQVNINKKVPI